MFQKMKKALALFLAMALTLGMAGLAPVTAQAAAGDVEITIVEATDIHGHMVEVPKLEDKTSFEYRMAYMAKMFNDLRAKGDVIALNGGDTFQGTPLSNLSYGKYVIQALDAMKFDASAVGNHEFDWGIEQVTTKDATLKDSKIPMLASNLFVKATNKLVDFAKEYTILERGGKKIAVIGWADEYSDAIMVERFKDYMASEDATIVNKLAKELKESKKADAVVVLAHDDAQEAVEKFEAGNIDLVLGGHSHQIKVGTGSNGIPYGQGYKEARGFAQAKMTIAADGKVTVTQPEFITIYDSKMTDEQKAQLRYSDATKANFDEAVLKISDAAVEEVKPRVIEEIADLPVALNRTVIEGSLTSPMGNWMTDMMLYDETDVDIAFCNSGGLRTDFEAKKLTINDIYTLAPFNNLLYKVKMTGAQVVKVLEQVVGNESGMQMSGLTAKYDLSLPEDAQVYDVKMADGTPIDLAKTYTIVTNEFVATGGDGYKAFIDEGVISENTNVADNESLIEKVRKLGKEGPLTVDNNARFVAGTKPVVVPSTDKTKTAYVGQKFDIVVASLADDAKVAYGSSNKKVATVDAKGKVTVKAKGTATITAEVTQNGTTYKLQTKVTVKEPVIKMTAYKKQMKVGQAYTFKVKLTGMEGNVTWTSGNKKVAAVTGKGKVTAKAAGTTTIKATVNGKSVTCKVTVKAK